MFRSTLAYSLAFLIGTSTLCHAMEDPGRSSRHKGSALPREGAEEESTHPGVISPMYGGEESNRIFQARCETAIPQLAKKLKLCRKLYKNSPEKVEKSILSVIDDAAKARRDIAREVGDEEWENFGLTRDVLYFTGTHEKRYRFMRSHIQEQIRRLWRSGSLEWVIGESSRHRLQVYGAQDFKKYIKLKLITNFGIVKLPEFQQGALLSGQSKMNYDITMHALLVGEFAGNSCSEVYNSPKKPGLIWYQYALEGLIQGDDNQGEPVEYLPPPSAQMDLTQDEYFPSRFIAPPRFFYFETEYKLMDAEVETWVKGYGFYGMFTEGQYSIDPAHVTDEKQRDFPLMLCHPAPMYIPFLKRQYEQAFIRATLADSSDLEGLKRLMARLYFYWVKAMPYRRGSAAIMFDLLHKALYRSHGYEVEYMSEAGETLDHRGYMHWDVSSFLTHYMKNVKTTSWED